MAVQYHSGLQKLIQATNPMPSWRDVSVFYLWGPPGTGKTRHVFDEHGADNVYKKIDGQWWDGYEDQDVVLLDDFYSEGNRGDITLAYLLQLLDGHPIRVNVRGSTRVARWTKVYITANLPFETLYPNQPRSKRAALLRRCPEKHHIYFGGRPTDGSDEEEEQDGQAPERLLLQ